jgi:hypothetical protein
VRPGWVVYRCSLTQARHWPSGLMNRGSPS